MVLRAGYSFRMHSAEHRFSDFRFLMTPLTDFSWDPNEMIKLDLELNNRLSYIGMNRKNSGLQIIRVQVLKFREGGNFQNRRVLK